MQFFYSNIVDGDVVVAAVGNDDKVDDDDDDERSYNKLDQIEKSLGINTATWLII